MTILKKVKPGEVYMGRLKKGDDLWEEISSFCVKKNIRLGRVEAFGAVEKARLGYYNQKTLEYQFFNLNREFELTSLIGNISVKDGEPMIHAHVNLSDETGHTYGGHLAPGTIIFVCELIIEAFDGPLFDRVHDEETALPLWDIEPRG